ncbi:MAG: acyltransferase [Clostridiales bacterium]|nr:acyltransferase [Clostridiales bacterium]
MDNRSDNRNDFLLLSKYRNAIMGLAALWILFFHVWIYLSPPLSDGRLILVSAFERYITKIGYCGVDVFFLLSGYGLTFAIRSASIPQFYYRRLRRIFLPLLSIAILNAFIYKWSFFHFLASISGYNFYTKDIYSFLWFFPAIITLYLLFPIYYHFFKKAKNQYVFTTVAILIWLLATILLRNRMRTDLFGFTNRIPVFLIGILFGYIAQNQKVIIFNIRTWIVLVITLITGLTFAYSYNISGLTLLIPKGGNFLPGLLIAVSLPFLLAKRLSIAESKQSRIAKISHKLLAFIGSFSLELYAIQELAGSVILTLALHSCSYATLNLLQIVLIPAISWEIHLAFKYLWKLIDQAHHHPKRVSVSN